MTLVRRSATVVLLSLLVAAPTAAARRLLITQAQSGMTFHVAKGGSATLRLSGRWGWTYPRVSSSAVELVPVEYFRDPGFSEWAVSAKAAGRATIRSFGTPHCAGCGLDTRTLRVTILVR